MTRSHKLRFTPTHLLTYSPTPTPTFVHLCAGAARLGDGEQGARGGGSISSSLSSTSTYTPTLTKHVASPPPVLPACSSHLSFPFQYVNGGGREGYLPVDIASLMAWHRLDPPSCQPMSGKSVIFHSKQVRRKKKEKTIMSILVPWYTLYFIHTQHFNTAHLARHLTLHCAHYTL